MLTTIHDSSVTIFCCKRIKTCMLQEEQKGKGTREQTAAEKRTHAPLQYSSVMERNGRRPHKRLIAKASGVWVRQGYRGAAEWGVGLGGATRSEEVHRGGHVPSAEGPRSGGRYIRRILKRVWSGGGGRRRLGQLQFARTCHSCLTLSIPLLNSPRRASRQVHLRAKKHLTRALA